MIPDYISQLANLTSFFHLVVLHMEFESFVIVLLNSFSKVFMFEENVVKIFRII